MDTIACSDRSSSESAAISRRNAVLRLGGGGLAVLLASGLLPVAAQAQDASPMAGMRQRARRFWPSASTSLPPAGRWKS